MSTASTPVDVVYPESDGKPMGETDLHIHWTIRLRDMLKHRYRGQQVYVPGNLLVYYEEGNPRKFVVPDVFAATNCDPGERRVYKIWDEPAPPEFIIEVTSRTTRREDSVTKPRIYASIGVREYFVFDPTSDYLNPLLHGFRRADDGSSWPSMPTPTAGSSLNTSGCGSVSRTAGSFCRTSAWEKTC